MSNRRFHHRVNRRARIRVEDQGPTPETKQRLRPDPILTLWKLGVINDLERTAAEEIRQIVEAGLALQAVDNCDWRPRIRVDQRERHPLDAMSPALQRKWRLRFLPWAAAMRARFAAGEDVLAIVYSGILEDVTGERLLALKQGLNAYAAKGR